MTLTGRYFRLHRKAIGGSLKQPKQSRCGGTYDESCNRLDERLDKRRDVDLGGVWRTCSGPAGYWELQCLQKIIASWSDGSGGPFSDRPHSFAAIARDPFWGTSLASTLTSVSNTFSWESIMKKPFKDQNRQHDRQKAEQQHDRQTVQQQRETQRIQKRDDKQYLQQDQP